MDAVALRAERIARIFAGQHGADLELVGKLCGEIFQAVDSEINFPGGQRLFNFFGEHALGADLREGYVGDFVAGGVNDLDFDFVAALAQKGGDVVGLPES